jgi:hypothetical protein
VFALLCQLVRKLEAPIHAKHIDCIASLSQRDTTVAPLALGSNSVSLDELRTGRKTSEYTERARPASRMQWPVRSASEAAADTKWRDCGNVESP